MLTLDATLVLLVLTAGISIYAWSNHELLESWIMRPYVMRRQNEWYRLLTSGFLHANWMHLIFNMLAFYSFGKAVQNIFVELGGVTVGLLQFLALYLGGIVFSDLPTYFRHRNDPDYRSLGASGGVAAVIFAGIMFNPVAPKGQGIIIFPIPFPIQPFIFGFLYLAYSYYQGRRSGDNINHDAHFYGALYGVILTLAFYPEAATYFWQQIQTYLF
ncbi:Membrane associated serine protease, rhomboid family [Hymenobacter daecheongensis DSM 21074]|uniref:Membrane associated serine protease, rhomboid family n=1 Tax=Hymenobacter daecheongensis DSM 21074 TaxID=1121955 RepID=A0A1M6BA47_9BACT|nr:rhomboid family intramembrane serine protease [Hymenobacter daecheongensis]SHI45582.1 Membrane associated serine protease, rhomboid family [Hymenobacter daecheongensis DSM 21074]